MSFLSNHFPLLTQSWPRLGRRTLSVVLALLAFAPTTPAQSASGSIPVPYDSTVKRIGVSIVSASPELTALLQNAFKIHGAFDLAASGTAQYTFHADLAAGGRVTISVEPKAMGGSAFTTTGSGASWHEAAYRAADAVVEKLTTYPGFFAGRLAFVSTRTKSSELYTSDVLGQNIMQLTADHSRSEFPHWSPDGTKLIYMGYYRSGFPDIILYDIAAKTRKTIASYKGTNTGAIFSPDGRNIAMSPMPRARACVL
jgi:TolB protein